MGERVSERESLAHRLHADDLAHGRAVAMWDNLIPDARRWYLDNADAALAWFAEHRGPRVVSTVEEARDHWVAGALWALADQGNEMTPWLVEAVERRAVTEVVFTPTTESEDR